MVKINKKKKEKAKKGFIYALNNNSNNHTINAQLNIYIVFTSSAT